MRAKAEPGRVTVTAPEDCVLVVAPAAAASSPPPALLCAECRRPAGPDPLRLQNGRLYCKAHAAAALARFEQRLDYDDADAEPLPFAPTGGDDRAAAAAAPGGHWARQPPRFTLAGSPDNMDDDFDDASLAAVAAAALHCGAVSPRLTATRRGRSLTGPSPPCGVTPSGGDGAPVTSFGRSTSSKRIVLPTTAVHPSSPRTTQIESPRAAGAAPSLAMNVPRLRPGAPAGVAPEESTTEVKTVAARARRSLLLQATGGASSSFPAVTPSPTVGSQDDLLSSLEDPELPPPVLEAPASRLLRIDMTAAATAASAAVAAAADDVPRQMEAGGDWLLIAGEQLPSPSASAPPSAPHSPVMHAAAPPSRPSSPRYECRVVHFSCLCGTRYGDTMWLTGSSEALGMWRPLAVPMRYVRQSSGTHEWAADVTLVGRANSGSGSAVEYKYVLADKLGHIWWEPTASNRWLPPGATVVYDIFGTINF